jgi:hypothetical protein
MAPRYEDLLVAQADVRRPADVHEVEPPVPIRRQRRDVVRSVCDSTSRLKGRSPEAGAIHRDALPAVPRGQVRAFQRTARRTRETEDGQAVAVAPLAAGQRMAAGLPMSHDLDLARVSGRGAESRGITWPLERGPRSTAAAPPPSPLPGPSAKSTATEGTRTHNLRFTKPLLCQLSYGGVDISYFSVASYNYDTHGGRRENAIGRAAARGTAAAPTAGSSARRIFSRRPVISSYAAALVNAARRARTLDARHQRQASLAQINPNRLIGRSSARGSSICVIAIVQPRVAIARRRRTWARRRLAAERRSVQRSGR